MSASRRRVRPEYEGLVLARHHAGPLGDRDSEARHAYMRQATAGMYATNAIEAQLDLLYTYCQYELAHQHPRARHLTLYRGVNHMDEHEVLERCGRRRYRVLLNNLKSFSASRPSRTCASAGKASNHYLCSLRRCSSIARR